MNLKITVLAGDGIGPEVTTQGVRVLQALATKYGHTVKLDDALLGGCAIDATGEALPAETTVKCAAADAVLLGAVGGPKWSDPRAKVRPEQGLLGIRKALGLFANLRPVKVYDALIGASTLKPEVVRGVDMLIVRELTGGAYFGVPQGKSGERPNRQAVDTTPYSEAEIARLMRMAFELARGRRSKVTSVDKANVLATSRLWREVAHEVAAEYPDVQIEDVLVDACSMYLIRTPTSYDVIATENLFGDILSDEAAMLAGSMGMLPSASLGEYINRHGFRRGLYEPIHGSAPDIAGKGIANPLATILSCALMLRWSFGLTAEADAIERAVERALSDGLRCKDIASAGITVLGTQEMGTAVVERLEN
ncbi:MAG: 3-isopropylmalate dehydrogenase [Chloroflexi bacterium]|nr:3-isopropylmalate dehydrogenase [Chloroflexota bacterium]MCL5274893.1 3-isopropylmalate dehydrogenase [Chloroflexota bacterium]